MKRALAALSVLLACAGARAALADDDPALRGEIDALTRRVEANRARLDARSTAAPTTDEIAAAIDGYLAAKPAAELVGGGGGGKAGWPQGKRAYLSEGPNKMEFGFRSQVRYEAFLYGDDARASTTNDRPPKDRSGFEVETLLLDVQGTIFCPDLTYRMMLNFDADSIGSIEKRWMWLDWRYAGDHHVRAGQQKVVFGFEEYASAASLMFVDRNLVARAFGLNYDAGVNLWGTFGDCCEPKRFRYAIEALSGEGRSDLAGSVFNDARDKFSDQLLYAAMLEWNVTGRDWAWDEVDMRACDDRCRLDVSVGASGYYENDDDANLPSGVSGSLAVRGNGGVGPLERWGAGAWVRAQWRGFSLQSEVMRRHVDFTAGSTAPDQVDDGFYVQAHHRFAESNFGVGAKYAVVLGDDDTFNGVLKDRMWEAGVVVNYFFWDHAHRLSLDVTRVSGNSGVNSSGPGYMVGATRGVAVEDGWMARLQWQVSF